MSFNGFTDIPMSYKELLLIIFAQWIQKKGIS
jgi:hypothetical protein